ncbi:MAG: hypothetical protein WAK55_25540 [Xanthobacteraceae bacterium]
MTHPATMTVLWDHDEVHPRYHDWKVIAFPAIAEKDYPSLGSNA